MLFAVFCQVEQAPESLRRPFVDFIALFMSDNPEYVNWYTFPCTSPVPVCTSLSKYLILLNNVLYQPYLLIETSDWYTLSVLILIGIFVEEERRG